MLLQHGTQHLQTAEVGSDGSHLGADAVPLVLIHRVLYIEHALQSQGRVDGSVVLALPKGVTKNNK